MSASAHFLSVCQFKISRNPISGILRGLNFKIFQESIPPDPPRRGPKKFSRHCEARNFFELNYDPVIFWAGSAPDGHTESAFQIHMNPGVEVVGGGWGHGISPERTLRGEGWVKAEVVRRGNGSCPS